MGLRRKLRPFYVKVRETLGWERDFGGRYDDLECWAYFDDGSSMHWAGRPWVCGHGSKVDSLFCTEVVDWTQSSEDDADTTLLIGYGLGDV
jgi:hypothetical protein